MNFKKVFIAIIWLLLAAMVLGQTQQTQQQYQYKNSDWTVVKDWQFVGERCYGCPSFHWSVDRAPTANGYVFRIWFHSNSQTWDPGQKKADWRYTYLRGLKIYFDGHLMNERPIWIVFREEFTNSELRFTYKKPDPYIEIDWKTLKIP